METKDNSRKPESFMKIQTDHYNLPKFIVSEMIPTGVHLFAGSPKTGKSWLVLWLCDRVAKGEMIWEYDTDQCTVLYIALEDTKSTLHFRLEDITEMGSENAYAVTSCSSLDNGLLEEIDGFIQKHPDTRLIVIDTLQLIRDSESAPNYAADYMELRQFAKYTQEKDIAIILVHHLRKMIDSDPINMVSGSTGLIGAVDSILVLEKEKRSENTATLTVTGRRIKDKVLKLEFDEDTNVWKFIKYIKGEKTSIERLVNGIQSILQTEKRYQGSPTELAAKVREFDDEFNLSPNAMSRLLNENSISLKKTYGIYYSTKRTSSKRCITLSQLKEIDHDDAS